ncbi:MAG: porin family protein [Bacteroidota bacterium]
MKNVISLFVCLFLGVSSLFAQTQFGIKAGANFGDIIETIEVSEAGAVGFEEIAYRTRINPQLGVWLAFPFSDRLSIQPELLWTQKHLFPDEANPMDSYINFHYFSLPVLAKYKLGKFRVAAGPEVSFLLDQSFRNVDSPLTDSPFIDENEFEFAINFELQYTHNRWIIGARASRDVTNFRDFEFTDINGELTGSVRNFHQSGVVWVGYQIL